MMRAGLAAAALAMLLARPLAARPLEIFFIDVEGGESTLIVTPAGESLLIDTGYARNGRDPARIIAATREAHIDHIDYLLITHFHPDHVGGVPELATLIPIGTFIDYGEPLGFDRMTTGGFRNYEPVRAQHPHLIPKPGDRLPLNGVEATVVTEGGMVLTEPLPGGGQSNEACAMLEDQPDDGTENFRSIGIRLRLGAFRFIDLGDTSGNTLGSLVCPKNLLGEVSLYLVPHHGNYDTNVPPVLTAVHPRVAIMNNGATKGGDPDALATLHGLPWLEGLWQLHASRHPGAQNSPDDFLANVDDGQTSYWIKVSANEDGSFAVLNSRNGFSRTYSAPRR